MVVVEEQIVVGGDWGETWWVVVRTAPNLKNYILRERVLEQFNKSVVENEIEGISIVKVLLQEQVSHLILRWYFLHELNSDFDDTLLNLLHSSLHEAKSILDHVKELNQ